MALLGHRMSSLWRFGSLNVEVWRPPSEQNHGPLGAPALITGDENEGWIHTTWFK